MEQSTNYTPGDLPSTRSVEEALARIEAAVDDLARLTSPEVLDGPDAPTISQLVDAHTQICRLTDLLDGVQYIDRRSRLAGPVGKTDRLEGSAGPAAR
ncbi:hypothetical protein [Promicromonospora soli]